MVRLVLDQRRPVAAVAREIGIHENTLHKWINQYKKHKENAFPGSGHLRKTPEIAYSFIHKHRFEFRVEKMCRVFEVSRSGYYAWLKRPESSRKSQNRKLLKEIRKVYRISRGTYGSPRITIALQKEGISCGRNRVARLMRENGIAAKTNRKYKATTNSRHNYPVAENLVNQNFAANRPNRLWVADITYIPTGEGWLYLAAIEDLFQRKIVGWAMDSTMTRQLVLDALRQAVWRYRPPAGLIHHSDRGSQYACHDYQQALRDYGMICQGVTFSQKYFRVTLSQNKGQLKKKFPVYKSNFHRTDLAKKIPVYMLLSRFIPGKY